MNFIDYYFRNTPEDFKFKILGITHIFILVLTYIVVFAIYKKKDYLRDHEKLYDNILKLVAIVILFGQLTFLYFFFAKTSYGFEEGLPLFTCRIALYTAFFGIILNSSKLKGVTCYLGIIGGILAVIYPDMYEYAFPHALYVDFFLEHIIILWASCLFIFVEDFSFSKDEFVYAIFFTNIFLAISLVINYLLDSNYAYLARPPFAIEFFQKIPYPIFVIIIFATYDLLVLIVHKFCRHFKYKK